MAAATFTPELKANKDGTYTIRIRITKYREHAYWNIGKRILKGQWNKKPSLKLHNYIIEHENAKQINNAIKNVLTGLDQIADALPAAPAAGIKAAYEKALKPEQEEKQDYRNFFAFAEEYVARLKSNNHETGISFEKHLKEFKKFAGEGTPAAVLFSPGNLHKYIAFLKAKPNAPKTIKNKLVNIRTLYNRAVMEKAIADLDKPFAAVKINVPKKKKIRPTAAQVQAFINYEPKTPEQELAKLVTLLQYFLLGARISEALSLKWENVKENHVEYLPNKNAKKPKFAPRSVMLNKLLDSLPRQSIYVLPWLTDADATKTAAKLYNRKNQAIGKINTALKEIATELKINIPLSSHMFRHAFADALIAGGANPHTAAALLGHSDARTSEAYFKDLQLEDVSAFALDILNKTSGEQ